MDLESELKACGADLKPEAFIALILQALSSHKQALQSATSGPLTKRERAAYKAGGFDLEKRPQGMTCPLARSLAELAAIMADALTVKAAAELLSVQPTSVRRRLGKQSLYGFRVGGRYLLPRFQFANGRVIPGIDQVLQDMDRPLQPLIVCRFFLTPQKHLVDRESGDPQCPRDWLLSGLPVEPVQAIARNRVLI